MMTPLRRRKPVHAISNRSGVAAVEFALMAPVLFLLITVLLDFGQAFNAKLKMTNAVTTASQYAFSQGQSVSKSDVPRLLESVRSIILELAELSNPPTVAVLFNNSTSDANADNYYCVAGSPSTWTSTGSKPTACGGLVTSGQFVTINVSGQSSSFFFNDTIFGQFLAISESATVRVR